MPANIYTGFYVNCNASEILDSLRQIRKELIPDFRARLRKTQCELLIKLARNGDPENHAIAEKIAQAIPRNDPARPMRFAREYTSGIIMNDTITRARKLNLFLDLRVFPTEDKFYAIASGNKDLILSLMTIPGVSGFSCHRGVDDPNDEKAKIWAELLGEDPVETAGLYYNLLGDNIISVMPRLQSEDISEYLMRHPEHPWENGYECVKSAFRNALRQHP